MSLHPEGLALTRPTDDSHPKQGAPEGLVTPEGGAQAVGMGEPVLAAVATSKTQRGWVVNLIQWYAGP